MLNEIKEFEQYTLPFDASVTRDRCRLKFFKFIKGNFSGLERAMTVFARGYIFNKNQPFNETNTKEALKAWCGFAFEEDTPDTKQIKGWLQRYIIHLIFLFIEDFRSQTSTIFNNNLLGKLDRLRQDFVTDGVFYDSEKKPDVLEQLENEIKARVELKKLHDRPGQIWECIKALDKLKHKSELFTRGLYFVDSEKGDSKKEISFEAIIADALFKGELKRYYLVSDIDPFMQGMVVKYTGNRIQQINSASIKNKDNNDKDKILKVTAAFLLQQQGTEREYVYFNQTDTGNWLVEAKPDLGNKYLQKYKLRTLNEDMFSFDTVKGNISKLRIHPEWGKHFKLVRDCDIDNPENKGLIFYSDFGSYSYLQVGKRYS